MYTKYNYIKDIFIVSYSYTSMYTKYKHTILLTIDYNYLIIVYVVF